MKKILSKVFAFMGALVIAFSLASCGISAKSAEKINVAAAKDDHLTYSEVMDKFGAPTVNLTIAETGWCTWYEDCESAEDYQNKLEEGKTIGVLRVYFVSGKAQSATYEEVSKEK